MEEIFSKNDWLMIWNYKDTFILGFLNTLETAIIGIILSLVIGIIIGLMGTSSNKVFRTINRIYVEVIQNTPLLLQLCVFYYVLAFSGYKVSILFAGIISLGVYHGAYMAEVFRAGISSIPKGQFEAATSQGFNYVQRMYYIILPQSIKIILPPMVNQVVNLIRTHLVYIS